MINKTKKQKAKDDVKELEVLFAPTDATEGYMEGEFEVHRALREHWDADEPEDKSYLEV